MIKTLEGGYLLGGGSNGFVSANKTEGTRGGFDYWLVNTDAKGNLLWEKTIGGYYDEFVYGLAEPEKNKFVAGGFSYSPDGADKTAFSRGDADFWLVGLKYFNTISSSAEKNTSLANKADLKTLFAYPNPAKDKVTIKLKGKTSISLSGPSGKIFFTKTVNNNDVIDVSFLAPGLYYLNDIITGETQKILISR
jgi:hypothetical protein